MEKYRRVPREKTPIKQDEIRITASGRLPNYVTYAGHLFNQEEKTSLSIKATGNAIARAVTLAEVVKRRFRGLHQSTKCGSTTITDVYQPIEEGLDSVTHERTVSYIEITLTRDETLFDKNDPGYQAPLDDALVNELPPEEVARTGYRKAGAPTGGGGPPGRRGPSPENMTPYGYPRGGRLLQRGRGSIPGRANRVMPMATAGPPRMDVPMHAGYGYARRPFRGGGGGGGGGYGYRPLYAPHAGYPMRYEAPPMAAPPRSMGPPRGYRGGMRGGGMGMAYRAGQGGPMAFRRPRPPRGRYEGRAPRQGGVQPVAAATAPAVVPATTGWSAVSQSPSRAAP